MRRRHGSPAEVPAAAVPRTSAPVPGRAAGCGGDSHSTAAASGRSCSAAGHGRDRTGAPRLGPLHLLRAPGPTVSNRRIAIVIGNDRYEHLPILQKAANDARAVGDALVQVGFEVIRVENAPRRVMNQKLTELTGKIERGDTVFFFFAGHGVEIKGANYLLPIDTPPRAKARKGSSPATRAFRPTP